MPRKPPGSNKPGQGRPRKPPRLKAAPAVAVKLPPAPQATGVGSRVPPCPGILTAGARRIWRKQVRELSQRGVIEIIDREHLAIYCQAWDDWETARAQINALAGDPKQLPRHIVRTTKGNAIYNPWMSVAKQAQETIRTFGAIFGFSPSDRQRLNLPQAPASGTESDDPQAAWLRRMKEASMRKKKRTG